MDIDGTSFLRGDLMIPARIQLLLYFRGAPWSLSAQDEALHTAEEPATGTGCTGLSCLSEQLGLQHLQDRRESRPQCLT